MAIRPEHYGDIKLAADITDDLRQLTAAAAGSNGGGATLRQRQEGSSSVANRNGNGFVRLPSGARHRVVQEGTGRVPKASDTVKFDIIAWKDAFDGRDKAFDERREVDVCLIMVGGGVRRCCRCVRGRSGRSKCHTAEAPTVSCGWSA
mmetsp:Transcript_16615/g.47311  ORF Transcript_16615/g.47311 Transcript_16615/m.47311 type:complete len:148 (+) Transcript_16615:1085-1528(+)